MKRLKQHWVLRSLAMSLSCNLLLPVGVVWGADEIQVLRQSINSGGKVQAAVPFTTFQQEVLALTNALPCKWISKDGQLGPSYGGTRYDFLCKGGDFATVSLFMNKTSGDGIGSVRLLYREWADNANPNAGEAATAQKFLQHVVGRFVPAANAGEVMDAFWGRKEQSWSAGGVNIGFGVQEQSDRGNSFIVRKLEIKGAVKAQTVTMVPVAAARPMAVTPVDGGLAKPVGPAPLEQHRLIPGVIPPVTPTDAGLTIPVEAKPVVVPAGVLPLPGVGAPKTVKELAVPLNAPAGGREVPKEEPKVEVEQEGTLEKATPAELNTAPAPESKAKVDAPPEISASLVPTGADLKVGTRAKAPSNFDAYNRAVELTKDVEAKAQINRVEDAKVTASKPATAKPVSGTTFVKPATDIVPPLKAVPTPTAGGVPASPANTAGEGLAKPVAVEPAPTVDEIGQPENYNGPRRTEARPLPQLKFVPKAEPLKSDEVIQFEDEKSKL